MPVSLRRAAPLWEHANAAGVDISAVLSDLDLPVDLFEQDQETTINLVDYYRIQNRLSLLTGDETCHLSERQLLSGSTDFVLANVTGSKTILDSLRVIASSYNLLHGGQYNSVEVEKDEVFYVIDDRNFPYAVTDPDAVYFSMESTLIFFMSMLEVIFGASVQPHVKRVYHRRPERGNSCHHFSYWRVPMKFSAPRYKICFDTEFTESDIPEHVHSELTFNKVYAHLTETLSLQGSWGHQTIAGRVYDELLAGHFEQKVISSGLGMSVASLRRRLSEEGVTFRELRKQALNTQAKRMLLEQLSVKRVSEELGFAEFRSFVRAFKAWNDVTPSAFLQKHARPPK